MKKLFLTIDIRTSKLFLTIDISEKIAWRFTVTFYEENAVCNVA
jgi:hypothetical protein